MSSVFSHFLTFFEKYFYFIPVYTDIYTLYVIIIIYVISLALFAAPFTNLKCGPSLVNPSANFYEENMGIASVIAGLISSVFGPIVQWAQRRQELAAQAAADKAKLELELLKNQGVAEQYEAKAAMSRVKMTGEIFKYVMIGMWFYPWIMVQFSQAQAMKIFTNMAALPPFYSESCVMIMFAILGIPVGAKMANTVFNAVTGYYQGKRDALYQHEQTLAQIDRDKVFESLRESLGGKLSQQTVDMVNKAINAGDADPTNDGTTRGS